MDKSSGWVKIYRASTENWTFDNDEPKCSYAAWIDLILMMNHENKKTKIRGTVLEIRRGQKLTSIRKLAERWHWTRKRASNFLKTLQKDGMIYIDESHKWGTLITVCNYNDYQGFGSASGATEDATQDTTEDTTEDTRVGPQNRPQTTHKQECKNVKNDKEPKKLNPRPWGGMLEPE